MKISSGIEGLDRILLGGFLKGRAYFIKGESGTGRTTLGIHFLCEGVKNSEKVLFITLNEKMEKIKSDFEKIEGLESVEFLDLTPTKDYFGKTYEVFHPSEVEREEIFTAIKEKIINSKRSRVFIDSISEFRRLVPDNFLHKRQVISLLDFLNSMGATVLFTSETSRDVPDEDLHYIADGIIELKRDEEGIKISVKKMRGSDFISGWHRVEISERGMKVI